MFAPRTLLPLLLASLTCCKEPPPPRASEAAPGVVVQTVRARDVPLTFDYSGRVVAYRDVEVRARVAGVLQERRFTEGATVRAGDLLYRIDPAVYRAALDHAAAVAQQARATREKAERDLVRATALARTLAGTAQARDDAVSALALADAGVALAEADVRTAALNLSYTQVTAPIGGVTSLSVPSEGALVGTTADNTLLTRITATDPVYVTFAFDAADLREIRRIGPGARLTASVETGDGVRSGAVEFVDAVVDPQTGTVRGRATFTNPGDALMPGAFVTVRVSGVARHDAIAVAQAAIQQDAAGTFVFAVTDGHATRVPVTAGRSVGDERLVDGVAPGVAVIVEGVVNVREGGAVRVETKAAAS